MKAKIYTTALSTIIAVIFSINTFASEINFEEENYINDIPFNTEKIYTELMNERSIDTFVFEEEAYIDDIPFETELVVLDSMNENFEFEEEAYVDDIPFATEKIFQDYLYQAAMEMDFNFGDEESVDDIPFNTYEIANNIESLKTSVFYSAIFTPVDL